MRTTLTIDDDVAALLENENRTAHEPMKQTINRVLRAGLTSCSNPSKGKRVIVKPIDTGITRKQWQQWSGRKLEDVLEEADRLSRP